MPFTSKRQQRAAFGGHIPGFSKARAEEWADETDFKHLPDRAPAEKGKPTLLSKHSSIWNREDLAELFSKLSFAVPRPGKIMAHPSHVGSFSGSATNNFLKPPGPSAASQAVNPRLSIAGAMTKATRV